MTFTGRPATPATLAVREARDFLFAHGTDYSGAVEGFRWPELTDRLAEIVALRTRDEWCALLEGSDACFSPVLGIEEAPAYSHNVARGLFVEVEGIVQPGPVPRFSETPGAVQGPPPIVGAHTDEVLRDWGVGVPDKLGE